MKNLRKLTHNGETLIHMNPLDIRYYFGNTRVERLNRAIPWEVCQKHNQIL